MAALIDSSVFIAGERGQVDLADLLASFRGEPLALSAVTASELLYGLHWSRTLAQRERRDAYIEAKLTQMAMLAFVSPSRESIQQFRLSWTAPAAELAHTI